MIASLFHCGDDIGKKPHKAEGIPLLSAKPSVRNWHAEETISSEATKLLLLGKAVLLEPRTCWYKGNVKQLSPSLVSFQQHSMVLLTFHFSSHQVGLKLVLGCAAPWRRTYQYCQRETLEVSLNASKLMASKFGKPCSPWKAARVSLGRKFKPKLMLSRVARHRSSSGGTMWMLGGEHLLWSLGLALLLLQVAWLLDRYRWKALAKTSCLSVGFIHYR